jgi:membrane associated rhomboid family serine protease
MAIPPGPSSDSVTSVPTCYRHPGRETHVSCVRCGRYACPDCLRSAAVGQQCVECVRQGNRGSRQAVGMFGGRVSGTPVVTYTLIALNVVGYLIELANSKAIYYGQLIGLAYDPHLHEPVGVALGDWYRLFTSAFQHEPPGGGFGIFHILFNMYALYVVGPALERLLGRARFLAVYLVSALGGAVLFYILAPVNAGAIGASGAVFGLFGAWFVLSKRLRLDARMIVGLIVLNLIISFTVTSIAWQDHVGGLVCGAALTAAYAYAPRQNRTLIQAGATVAILALIVLGVVLRDEALVHQVIFRL